MNTSAKKVMLPCEFCSKKIVSHNLLLHQSECQLNLASFQNMQLEENITNESNEDTNNVEIPCEFCEIPIILNNLMSHQIMCRKKFSKIHVNSQNFNCCTIENNTENILEQIKPKLFNLNLFRPNDIASDSTATCSYQSKFSKGLPINTNDSEFLELILPSKRKNYSAPTSVLRNPEFTNDQLCEKSSIFKKTLNESTFLTSKFSPGINSCSFDSSDQKFNSPKSDDSATLPFLNLVEAIQKPNLYSCNHVSYSEHYYILTH